MSRSSKRGKCVNGECRRSNMHSTNYEEIIMGEMN